MKIMFVCTGNSCRSPMAEALARDIFACEGLELDVISAGVSVLLALPASENAIAVMKDDYNIDISEHRTRQITRDDLVSTDLVLVMTERHKGYLALQAADMRTKVYTLAQFAGHGDEDIADPFGGEIEDYRRCASQLKEMITEVAVRLKDELETRLAVASDHGGFALKRELLRHLDKRHIKYTDFGAYDEAAADYPDYAKKTARAILGGEYHRGLLICGTGIGISIAANRFRGIRAALCHDVFSAKASREHNDANILVMGGRVVGPGLAREILDAFLDTRFSGEARHSARIAMIEEE